MDKKIKSNLMLRILSVGIAIIIWLYVILTQDPVMNNTISSLPINSILTTALSRENLQVISMSQKNAEISVWGKRSVVLSKSRFSASINLGLITQPGYYTLSVDIDRPDGVEIKSRHPQTVDVYVDKNITVEKQVVIAYNGTPKQGYEISATGSANAFVTGPSMLIHKVAYLSAVVDVDGLSASGQKNVKLIPADSTGQEMKNDEITTPEIPVSYNAIFYKEVTVKPVLDQASPSAKAEATPKKVIIYGNPEKTESMSEIYTTMINVGDQQVGSAKEYEAELILPQGIFLKKDTSTKVKVMVTNK